MSRTVGVKMIHIKSIVPVIALTGLTLGITGCAGGDPEANAPQTYVNSCALCHREGEGGAPILGDKADWAKRTAKGMEQVYANAIDGFTGETGIMPARGSRPDLSDEEIKKLVDFMVEASK